MQNNTFSTLFVGQNLVTLNRVDSTNNFLKQEVAKSTPLPEGTVILAEEQFAGRGQVNNTWTSEPGKNLTFSLLLFPSFLPAQKQFLLNQAISIAINDALANIIGPQVKIKWPNDIYFKDDKLGGVLIENVLRGNNLKYAIVGIGINVNQLTFPSTIKNVTSLKEILHRDYHKIDLLSQLCKSIEQRYLQLRSGNYHSIEAEYLSNLYKLNELHTFKIEGKEEVGVISGIDEFGCLQIRMGGELRTFDFKEVAFVQN